ncbi:uncharacterized protein [Gorilla gorilla gorilla]|uniref:uncharacterized protein n=1 Tax=Gorilla gorilla gorilla TaxID=9595 RepID=UPI003008465D
MREKDMKSTFGCSALWTGTEKRGSVAGRLMNASPAQRPACQNRLQYVQLSPRRAAGGTIRGDKRHRAAQSSSQQQLLLQFFNKLVYRTHSSKWETDGPSVDLGDICFGNAQHDRVCERILSSWVPLGPAKCPGSLLLPEKVVASPGVSLEGFAAMTVTAGADGDLADIAECGVCRSWEPVLDFLDAQLDNAPQPPSLFRGPRDWQREDLCHFQPWLCLLHPFTLCLSTTLTAGCAALPGRMG